MNEIEMWEVVALYESLQFADKNLWETARLVSYFITAPYMKDKKKLSEFMELPWDKGFKDSHRTEITNEEIADLKKKSDYFSKILKGGK